MTDHYKCINCHKVFDEFEMNYRDAAIDKLELCKACRAMFASFNRSQFEGPGILHLAEEEVRIILNWAAQLGDNNLDLSYLEEDEMAVYRVIRELYPEIDEELTKKELSEWVYQAIVMPDQRVLDAQREYKLSLMSQIATKPYSREDRIARISKALNHLNTTKDLVYREVTGENYFEEEQE